MYPLRYSATPWFTTGVNITKAGGTYKLASTQGYQTMDTPEGARPLVRTASLEEYRKEPDFAQGRRASSGTDVVQALSVRERTLRVGHGH